MRVYLEVIKYAFLEEKTYPTEIISFVIRKLISLGFLLIFWSIIAKTNPDLFTIKQIISYFLISEAVINLTFTTYDRFARFMIMDIKNGKLSNDLIKPVDVLNYRFAHFIGSELIVDIYIVFTLFLGIYLYRPASIWGILFFPISIILTTMVGYGINTFLGIVGFYSTEGQSVINFYSTIRSIASGAMMPLSYFPSTIRIALGYTPFPILSYYPVVILQNGDLDKETLMKLLISIIWAIILFFGSRILWKKALKHYDGVGI